MPEHNETTHILSVETKYFDSTKHLHGFVMGWFSGESDDVKFEVDSTAGLGGTAVYIRVTDKRHGDVRTESIDFGEVAKEWAERIIADLRANGGD
jgi:hypothetical protein